MVDEHRDESILHEQDVRAVVDDQTKKTGPSVEFYHIDVAAAAATADTAEDAGVAEMSGAVLSVWYTPASDVTGANTDTRTLSLINRGSDGDGTTVVATLALTSGNDLDAHKANEIPLSSTAADLDVSGGEVLAWTSTHAGSTGLADPGGVVTIAHDGSRWY